MPADTTTSLLGLLLQGTGNNDNTWGDLTNDQVIQLIENAIAGRTAYVVDGGTDTLTAAERRSAILDFSGTLLADQNIVVSNLTKTWTVKNGCTLGAFALKMKTATGTAVTIPSGTWKVWCDGADGVFIASPAALVAIGSLTPAADKLAYFTSGTAATLADLSTFARTILDDADAATVRATLGLVIGTNVQAFDADLSTIAANITAAGHAILDDASAAAQRTTLGLVIGTDVRAATLRTRQTFLSGTAATYTTPAGCRQLRIRMVGGGGGGAAINTNEAADGGSTSFNSIVAAGGSKGTRANGTPNGNGGNGGTGGAGSATLRLAGGGGACGTTSNGTGGNGGSSAFGGNGIGGTVNSSAGQAGAANTGGGGGGAGIAGGVGAGGGGAGEYVELIINSPSATYTYTVGGGGAGGVAGGVAGAAGGSGIIIVDEYY